MIEAWQAIDESWMRSGPDDEVAARLRSITGFGEWSTQFVLFRGLGRGGHMTLNRPNAEAMRSAYGDRPDDELQATLDGYGPWAGYVLLYIRAGSERAAFQVRSRENDEPAG